MSGGFFEGLIVEIEKSIGVLYISFEPAEYQLAKLNKLTSKLEYILNSKNIYLNIRY